MIGLYGCVVVMVTDDWFLYGCVVVMVTDDWFLYGCVVVMVTDDWFIYGCVGLSSLSVGFTPSRDPRPSSGREHTVITDSVR